MRCFVGKGSYAVKLDHDLLNELKAFCETKGYKQSSFVEKALREQMELEELKDDVFDLVSLRSQEVLARPFGTYHRHRK